MADGVLRMGSVSERSLDSNYESGRVSRELKLVSLIPLIHQHVDLVSQVAFDVDLDIASAR